MPDLQATNERELISRAQQGSVEAFEQLVLAYQDRLYRFLLARSNNRPDAEDALQEAFVAAFQYLPGYRDKYRFSTWLFTIAARKLGQSRSKPGQTSFELDEAVRCDQPGPEQLGAETELRRSIWQLARKCLNPNQFNCLWLFYVEDMPLAEIARVTGRPVSWIKVNLMRSRQRLAKALEEQSMDLGEVLGEVIL
jgi:RNA polymerase sigma-70 factor (ECF subfamily)